MSSSDATIVPGGAAEPAAANAAAELALSGAAAEPALAGPSSDTAVQTRGLTKRFGARTAIDGVDLRVPRGSAFGFLGPNGAGKTTMIRMLLGLTRASSGSMSLLGHPVPAERAQALSRVGGSWRSLVSISTSQAGRTCA